MEKEERKGRIAKLRKWHEGTFELLGNPNSYYCCKVAHYAKEGDVEKVVGLFASECQKGDNVYVEFCTHDYTPIDPSRRLYVWEHDAAKLETYEVKKNQFLVPVSDLKPVEKSEYKLCVQGEVYEDTKNNFTIERTEVTRIDTYRNGNSVHKATYIDGKLFRYTHTNSKKIGAIIIEGDRLLEVIEFFKQLK